MNSWLMTRYCFRCVSMKYWKSQSGWSNRSWSLQHHMCMHTAGSSGGGSSSSMQQRQQRAAAVTYVSRSMIGGVRPSRCHSSRSLQACAYTWACSRVCNWLRPPQLHCDVCSTLHKCPTPDLCCVVLASQYTPLQSPNSFAAAFHEQA
jgi:hypothetical protein